MVIFWFTNLNVGKVQTNLLNKYLTGPSELHNLNHMLTQY